MHTQVLPYLFIRRLWKMQLSKQSYFWHADTSNMIFGHTVKKIWLNVIFVWITAVFQFPLLLNLDFFCRYRCSKIFKFLSSSGTSCLWKCKIQRKMWIYTANHGINQGLLWNFPKSRAGKFKHYFIQILQLLLFLCRFILVKRCG